MSRRSESLNERFPLSWVTESRLVWCVAIAIAGFAEAYGQTAVTSSNWMAHPKIVTVREIVESIENGLSAGKYTVMSRSGDRENGSCHELKLAVDTDNRPVKLEKACGSEDSALRWAYYYDARGTLRFVFITGGSVYGTRIEHRLYLDDVGITIWEDHKLLSEPVYPFEYAWSDEYLVRDPFSEFNSKK